MAILWLKAVSNNRDFIGSMKRGLRPEERWVVSHDPFPAHLCRSDSGTACRMLVYLSDYIGSANRFYPPWVLFAVQNIRSSPLGETKCPRDRCSKNQRCTKQKKGSAPGRGRVDSTSPFDQRNEG